MTIEELMKVFNRAKWDLLRAGDYESLDRAGVVAIVRAMRDEIWMRTKRMDACDILLEILGPIEGQGAAKESGGRDRKYGPAQVGGGAPSPTYYIPAEDWWARFMNARIVVVHGCDAGEKVAEYTGGMNDLSVTPPTDPAPAVCVWTSDATRGLDGLPHLGWNHPHGWTRGPKGNRKKCHHCGLPIKFTEAK